MSVNTIAGRDSVKTQPFHSPQASAWGLTSAQTANRFNGFAQRAVLVQSIVIPRQSVRMRTRSGPRDKTYPNLSFLSVLPVKFH
jgi:hypothetical protein